MTQDKTLSEREAVLRERQAWIAGQEAACWRDPATEAQAMRRVVTEAAARYPLPTVERPRILWDSQSVAWRVVEGDTIQWTYHPDVPEGWLNAEIGQGHMFITAERVKMLADLLARPTETREDTEDDQ